MLKLTLKRFCLLGFVTVVSTLIVIIIARKLLFLENSFKFALQRKESSPNVTNNSYGVEAAFEKARKSSFQPALERPKSYTGNGLGELGIRVVLFNLTKKEKKKQKRLQSIYYINQFLSQKISLHRTLKDARPPQCDSFEDFDYSKLPSTSVIIVFFDEGLSTLLRTIYSVLHNTHNDTLLEIILIDDASRRSHLKKPLETRLQVIPKTRLLRNKQREGIVRSRLRGLSEAEGEVVAFIDAHCECTFGWLEPLLVSIMEDNSTIAAPVTNDIDPDTFQYYYGNLYEPSIGGFTWDLFFHWRPMSAEQRSQQENHAQPIRTPTISGGLFAVNKKFFLHIGSYDPGMDVWGGENVEVSFRTWMCGGQVLIHPCSHIGHVSRLYNTYSRASVWKNVARAAAVWFDEKYQKIFRVYLHEHYRNIDYGDVSKRKELIKDLKCHDFDWYLKNVFPEKYVPENVKGSYGRLQQLELNSFKLLRASKDKCAVPKKNIMKFTECPSKNKRVAPDFMWTHSKDGLLRHESSNKCLELAYVVSGSKSPYYNLYLNYCDARNSSQQWIFKDADETVSSA